jgi:hypothetical protein
MSYIYTHNNTLEKVLIIQVVKLRLRTSAVPQPWTPEKQDTIGKCSITWKLSFIFTSAPFLLL